MKFRGQPSSGSAGNQTWSRNRGGQYIRTRSGGGGPGDSFLATAVADWQAMTDAQRAAWAEWHRLQPRRKDSLGQAIETSVFNAYCGVWMSAQYGGPGLPTPPPYTYVPQAVLAHYVGSALTIDVATSQRTHVSWWSSGVVTPATMSPPGRGKWWGRFGDTYSSTSFSFDVTADWVSRWGAQVSGDYLWVEIRVALQGVWSRFGRFRLQVP